MYLREPTVNAGPDDGAFLVSLRRSPISWKLSTPVPKVLPPIALFPTLSKPSELEALPPFSLRSKCPTSLPPPKKQKLATSWPSLVAKGYACSSFLLLMNTLRAPSTLSAPCVHSVMDFFISVRTGWTSTPLRPFSASQTQSTLPMTASPLTLPLPSLWTRGSSPTRSPTLANGTSCPLPSASPSVPLHSS